MKTSRISINSTDILDFFNNFRIESVFRLLIKHESFHISFHITFFNKFNVLDRERMIVLKFQFGLACLHREEASRRQC